MFTPAHDWSEQIPPGEAADLERLAAALRALQHSRGGTRRALHARSHGGVQATLEVRPDLPEWARVGIFASAGRYDALVRFSAGAGLPQPDSAPDVRGLAVKVLGVPGKKLIPGMEAAQTQDFLCILADTLPMPRPDQFLRLVLAASGPPILALPRIIGIFGLFGFLPVLKKLKEGQSRPVPSLAEMTWHTPVPIRWGKTAVKYRFVPVSSTPPSTPATADDDDRLHLDLRDRLGAGPVVFDLQIQGYVDATRTPIEDPRVAWDDALSPPVTVARLTLPKQDLTSHEAKRRHEAIEKLSFDPWHAPEEFRPIGGFMRARAIAYRESVIERGVAPEPERMI